MKSVMSKYKKYIPAILMVVLFLLGQAMGELMLPSYMSDIVNKGIAGRNQSLIYSVGSIMIGVAFASVLCAILGNMIASRVAAGVARDIRSHLFKRVMSYSAEEFENFSTASLITRSTNDVQNIQQTTVMMLRVAVFAPVMGIGALVNAIRLSPGMTWTIAIALFVVLIFMICLFVAVMPKFSIMQDKLDRLNLIISERLSGILVVRAFSSEYQEEARFDDANVDLTKINIFVNRAMAVLFPSITLLMNCTCVLIIWVGAKMVGSEEMMVGDVMAFMQYAIHVVSSFLFITMIFILIPRAAVSARRVGAVLDMPTGIRDGTEELLHEGSGTVTFEDVDFSYPGSQGRALKNISFTAPAGKTTAIIGGTGSGKSSLINLIPRFYDVTTGSIKIDGVDVRSMKLTDLRSKIGFVPQKNVLFNGTVRENILFGKPEATEEELRKVADIARVSEFVDKLPEGMDTLVAQGGKTVSGGQRQRLAIARALIKDSDICIFDDSFSALDFQTDFELRKKLNENMPDKTIIIVAQRINTIANADRIIVMDEGKIAGIGAHEELMRSCNVYREIAASQLSEEEVMSWQ